MDKSYFLVPVGEGLPRPEERRLSIEADCMALDPGLPIDDPRLSIDDPRANILESDELMLI